MKKFTALLLVLLMSVAAFASCADDVKEVVSDDVSTEASDAVVSEESEESKDAASSEDSSDIVTDTVFRIGGLKGPTSMGLVKLMQDNEQDKSKLNYDFKVEATADMISPLLIKGELDMVAVPANLASILYNNTQGKVKVLAINTLGVIYIVEKNAGITNLADLKGKTIYATGKGSTPEYNLRYLLSQAGVDPDKDVTIEWKSEPNEVVALLKNSDSGVAMLPQPYVTVAQTQVPELKIAINLNEEWNKLNNGSMMVTGVLVARADFVENNKGAIDTFLNEYKASTEYINSNPKEASVWVEERIGVKAAVAEKAVPYCNITFISGADMKEALSGYLKVLYDQNAKSVGGAMPADGFYYGA